MIEYNMYIISLNTGCLKNVKLSLLKIFCLCTVVRYHSVSIGRTLTEDRDDAREQSYVQTAPVSDLAEIL